MGVAADRIPDVEFPRGCGAEGRGIEISLMLLRINLEGNKSNLITDMRKDGTPQKREVAPTTSRDAKRVSSKI
jgi:hypothetical protein